MMQPDIIRNRNATAGLPVPDKLTNSAVNISGTNNGACRRQVQLKRIAFAPQHLDGIGSRTGQAAPAQLPVSSASVEPDLDKERQKCATYHGADGREDERRQRALPAVRLQYGMAGPLWIVMDGDGLSAVVRARGFFREFAQAIDRGAAPIRLGAYKVALVDFVGVAQIDLVAMDLANDRLVVIALVLDGLLDHVSGDNDAGRGRPPHAGAGQLPAAKECDDAADSAEQRDNRQREDEQRHPLA